MRRSNFFYFLFIFIFSLQNVVLSQPPAPPLPPTSPPPAAQPSPVAQPSPAPVVQPSAQPAATAAVFEQKKWPEVVELTEEKKGIVSVAWKEDFEKYLSDANKVRSNINAVISQIRILRKTYQDKYKVLDQQLDLFLKDIGLLRGKIQEQLLISNKAKEIKSTPEKRPEALQAEQDAKRQIEVEADLAKLKNEMEAIDKLEEDLLGQLRKLDNQLDIAMDESISARKLSIEMLNATDKSILDANLNKIKESFKKVEQIKNSLQIGFSKKFNESLNQMQTQMQKLQANVKKLEEKGLYIGTQAEQKIFESNEKEEDKIRAEKMLAKKEVKEKFMLEQARKKETAFYRKTVDFFAASITFVNNAANWIVDVLKQTFKKSEKSAKPEGGAPVVSEQVQAQIKTLDEDVEKIQEEKTQIKQARQELEQLKGQKIAQAKGQVSLIEKFSLKKESKQFEWRKGLGFLFAKILDLATFVGQRLKFFVVKVYDTFFKDKLTNFVKSVKYRMKELKKTEQGQTKEPKNIEAQVPIPQNT